MIILVLSNKAMGLYKFREELLERLCSKNKVIIAVPNDDYVEKLRTIGCEYVPFEFNRRGINPIDDLKQIARYISLIKQIRPDVVLTYTIKPNAYGGIACRITHTPYLANVTGLGTSIENGGLLSFISSSLYRIGLKSASCVFFQNEANRELFLKRKIVSGKTRLIPGSGVNLEAHCVEEYPETASELRFLFIGRIMKDKGIDELLDAVEIIHSRHNNVSLDILGPFDENYNGRLSLSCSSGYVRYHGEQKKVHEFYKNTHCTVLPSYHEGTANVILESASTGRPVITTRVPGCKETFDEGITGIGCDAKSVDSLVEAMERFISLSREEKIQMGLAGRRKMEREYDRNLVINAYLEEIDLIKK